MLSGESDLMYIFCIVNFLLSTTVCLYVSGTVYHICGCQNIRCILYIICIVSMGMMLENSVQYYKATAQHLVCAGCERPQCRCGPADDHRIVCTENSEGAQVGRDLPFPHCCCAAGEEVLCHS